MITADNLRGCVENPNFRVQNTPNWDFPQLDMPPVLSTQDSYLNHSSH